MAYVSNATEAALYMEPECEKCPLGPEAPCPIYQVHFTHNYDQFGNNGVKSILETLWPSDNEGYPGPCSMRELISQTIGAMGKFGPQDGIKLLPGFEWKGEK